jgi:hypothetical protein
MCRKLGWMMELCIAMTAVTAMGQASAPASQPATPVAIEDALMPDGPFNGVSLDDLLSLLRQKIPGFNSVVIRAPGTPADYPAFGNLSVKNVTLGQFLDVVRASFPGVVVQRIDGRIDPVYVVHIFTPPGMPATPEETATKGSGETTSPVVKVYSLQDTVNALADGGDTTKALNDVLSLLQTALDQQGGSDQALLKVHQPTMMLIFKGSPTQMIVLEQTLNALGPNVSSEAQKLKSQYSQALQHFSTLRQQDQETITALRGQVDNLNAQIPVLQNQLVVLKAQLLETTNAAGKPKG